MNLFLVIVARGWLRETPVKARSVSLARHAFPHLLFALLPSSFFRGGSFIRIVNCSCGNLGTEQIRSRLECFFRQPHLHSSSRRSGFVCVQISTFLSSSTAPPRSPPPHHTMGFTGAFTLRLILLSYTVNLALALPSHYRQSLATIRGVIRTPSRGLVAGIRSGSPVNGMGQSRVNSGSASDGAGSGFDVPMVLWLSFGPAVGLFLTLGGMRLWRATKALAIGLGIALCGQSDPSWLGYRTDMDSSQSGWRS